MKTRTLSRALLLTLTFALLLGLCACGGTETTTRMEAEYGKITYGSLDKKDMTSNGFFVTPTGHGFTFADKDPMVVDISFSADKAADATIVVCLASSNTFGNEFELGANDLSFYFNNTLLTPESVKDYEGNDTNTVPKEDFTEGTGWIYVTYKVKLVKGDNTFSYRLTPPNGTFKYDYIDVTTTAAVTFTPDTAMADNWTEPTFNFD